MIKIRTKGFTFLLAFLLVFGLFTDAAYAGALSSQYVVMSSTTPSATSVTWTIHFKPSATTGIKQIGLKVCDADGAYGSACNVPTDLVWPATNGVTLGGFGDNTLTSAAYSSPEETIVKTNNTAEVSGTD